MISRIPRNRVLVAEDELDTLRGIQKILTRRGYNVDTACNGLVAAEKVADRRFDVVISDLKMPGLDGLDLLSKARAANKDIVFILITAYGTVDSAVEAMRLGAFDYISKPFTFSELVEAIEKGLKGSERESTTEVPVLPPGFQIQHFDGYHAWTSVQLDGTVVVGADEKFYEMAGEIVYCDLPLEGEHLVKGEQIATTTNTLRHINRQFRCPVSGEVIKVNGEMERRPWDAQKSPYQTGWLFVIAPGKPEKESLR
jgi:CheY-like chemotaxis protein/glycine cleavage system H lipoate-binding protein